MIYNTDFKPVEFDGFKKQAGLKYSKNTFKCYLFLSYQRIKIWYLKMTKNKKIKVQQIDIVIYEDNKQDYISLTDIARYRDAERSDYILQNWLQNRSTIDFIGLGSNSIIRVLIVFH